MSLADRLGPLRLAPTPGCGVCDWYGQLSQEDRDAFDDWLASGGNVSYLWRSCSALTDEHGNRVPNPLRLGPSAFDRHIREHHHKQ